MSKLKAGLFVSLFALIGVAVLLATHAATPVNNAIEAESGTASNGASILGDPNASGGSYVAFAASAAICPAGQIGAPPNCTTPSVGGAGCGFAAAAFCEDFSSGPKSVSREGEMNPAKWQVARVVGEQQPNSSSSFPSTPVPACKTGVSTSTADDDLMVCDSASGHLGQMLLSLSAQNYAFISMRPRQPFDFANRTGTIAFNVDAVNSGGLGWWTSLFISDQPDIASTNSNQVLGLLPKNGIGILFDNSCNTGNSATMSGVGQAFTYNNYVETSIASSSSNPLCMTTAHGQLNHIEVRMSQTNVEVWGSDKSTDGGVTFPNLQKLFTSPINLNFSRGYVHFMTNERAPVKYVTLFNISPGYADNYWTKLGFDGPVIATGEVGFQLPDQLNMVSGGTNIAYVLPATLTIPNVNLTGATTAKLAFMVSYTAPNASTIALHYSLNGGPVHDPNPQPDYAAEQVCQGCPGPTGGGEVPYTFNVPLSELHAGSNTISFTVDNNTYGGYPPILTNLDLLTFTGNAP